MKPSLYLKIKAAKEQGWGTRVTQAAAAWPSLLVCLGQCLENAPKPTLGLTLGCSSSVPEAAAFCRALRVVLTQCCCHSGLLPSPSALAHCDPKMGSGPAALLLGQTGDSLHKRPQTLFEKGAEEQWLVPPWDSPSSSTSGVVELELDTCCNGTLTKV